MLRSFFSFSYRHKNSFRKKSMIDDSTFFRISKFFSDKKNKADAENWYRNQNQFSKEKEVESKKLKESNLNQNINSESNSNFPKQTQNSNFFFKVFTPNTNPNKEKENLTNLDHRKMIILKKHGDTEHSHLNFEAPRLPKEITKKWEQFFKKNTKIPLDINRAVNNFPDKVYKYFFTDMRESFNEKQLLFAMKNIFLHRDSNTLWPNIYYNLKNFFYKDKFNKSSKINLMMLYEVAYLNSKEGGTIKLFFGFFEKVSDAIRLQSNKLPIAEMIFVLNSMLKYNFFDGYLINLLFERFSFEDFNQIMRNKNVYKVKYFGYEVRLAVPLMNIVNKYVGYCNSVNVVIPQKNKEIIEKILKAFIESVHKDTVSIDELCYEHIEFKELFSLFKREDGRVWEKSLNNLILVKLEESLSRSIKFPEEAHNTNAISLASYITLLNQLSTNCKESLFESIFHKLCYCAVKIFPQEELYRIGIKQMNETYGDILNKDLYVSIFNQLIEISINHKLFNKEIITPFLVCFLYYDKICKTKNELSPLFITFGKYNFDDILKSYEFPQITLNVYFTILQIVDSNLKLSLNNSLLFVEKIYKTPNQIEGMLRGEKLKHDLNVNEINKLFYTHFGTTVETEDKISSNLHYEKDEVLKNENALNLIRYAGITKKYFMSFYYNEYGFSPETNNWNDRQKNSLFNIFEMVLDSMLTGINSKILNVSSCTNFLEFMTELNRKVKVKSKEKNSESGVNFIYSNVSLLDIIIKDLILKNKSIYEKLIKVICFIFHPQNFYDTFTKHTEKFTSEKLKSVINTKYDLSKYKVNEENFHFENFNLSNRKVFKDSLTGLIEMDKENSEFLEKFYKSYNDVNKNMKIFQKDRFKFEFENFSNFLAQNDDLYYSIDQLEIDFNSELKKSGANLKENSEKITLLYLLLNLSKISKMIEEFFLSYAVEEITGILNDYQVDRKIPKKHFEKENFSTKSNTENDLSNLTREEILSSNLFYEYLRDFVSHAENNEKKPVDFKKYKIDKSIDKLIKNFPIFPFDSQYAFSTKSNPNLIEWLILANSKYKNTEVTDIIFENKISFLKSQHSNILII